MKSYKLVKAFACYFLSFYLFILHTTKDSFQTSDLHKAQQDYAFALSMNTQFSILPVIMGIKWRTVWDDFYSMCHLFCYSVGIGPICVKWISTKCCEAVGMNSQAFRGQSFPFVSEKNRLSSNEFCPDTNRMHLCNY